MSPAAISEGDIAGLGHRAEAMLQELAQISAAPDQLVRLFLSPEHRRAAGLLARWMGEAGLAVDEDALGTVRGRWAGPPGGRLLLIGSHFDTVIDAGKYDGTFGIVAGILALSVLRQSGFAPPFGIDLLAFGDEEGSRFPATLASSSACAGAFRTETLDLADRDGITLAEAIRAYGGSPQAIGAAAYRAGEAAAYVELHIEQGPVLESRNRPLGVVSAIVGQTYLKAEWQGMAGHAGTVPMRLRRDALAGACEAVLLAETLARDTQGEVLATTGKIEVAPGATNVIPGRVTMVVDIRSGSDAARAAFAERYQTGLRAIAAQRDLGLTVSQTREVATTPCHPALQAGLGEAVRAVAGDAPVLPSGAGHDGTSMAKLCPVGMLFVRCRDGISHNPLEFAAPQDMGLAIAALIRFIRAFDPAPLAA